LRVATIRRSELPVGAHPMDLDALGTLAGVRLTDADQYT
jgi:hypothetical protein